MKVVLVSCYELGHQPFAVASAWAQLERAGFEVSGYDASVDRLPVAAFDGAGLVAFSVPMHTALRLGVTLAARARHANPDAHVCLFGLYAQLNADHLLARTGGARPVADSVIGGEFEAALVALAERLASGAGALPAGVRSEDAAAGPVLERLAFVRPRRDRLPVLGRYAKLEGPTAGMKTTVGYVEASRGCLHRCRHCPVTPVYEGRFFVVPEEVVLADVTQQVEAGARHITFGDPDFFNGVGHAMALVRALAERHPGVTFDVTVKVEHILRHRRRFAELAQAGCLFVVSAFESVSDRVLTELDKGHSAADIDEALTIVADAGIAIRPTFVAFTPWTTLEDYVALADFVVSRGLVDHVDPIQMAIRLLVPPGSALAAGAARPAWLGELQPESFGYRWTHDDPRVDALQREVSAVVETAGSERDPGETFMAIRAAGYRALGVAPPAVAVSPRRFVPRLTEPWFCCAEPSATQLASVSSFGFGE